MRSTFKVLAVAVGVLGMGTWAWANCGACGSGEKHAEHVHGDHVHAEVGKPAPDFTLKDVNGNEHKLSDLKGKVVVLEWTNFTCPYVVRHQKTEKTMQETYAAFEGKDVVWLAIDSTRKDFGKGHTADEVKAWAENDDVKLPYPVLLDADGQVGQIYEAKTTPHMFVIDKTGTLVYAGAIDNDPHGDKGDEATNYVQAAVDAVLSGSEVKISSSKPYGCGVKYAKSASKKADHDA